MVGDAPRELTWIRRALGLVVAGLAVELIVSPIETPAEFLGLALVAAPLMGGGMILFLFTVYRVTRGGGGRKP